MAKDKTEKPEEIEKKPKFNIKVLLIGIPLFMIQLIIVYFITANFLLDKWKEGNQQLTANSNAELTSENKNEDNTSASQNELGKYVEVIEKRRKKKKEKRKKKKRKEKRRKKRERRKRERKKKKKEKKKKKNWIVKIK